MILFNEWKFEEDNLKGFHIGKKDDGSKLIYTGCRNGEAECFGI